MLRYRLLGDRALPDELAAKIEAFEVSDEKKEVLKAVSIGVPVPEAAKRSALQSTRVLFQAAVGLALICLESGSIVQGHRRNGVFRFD